MKNSSSVSSTFVRDDSSTATDLLSTRGRLGSPCPTDATVLPPGAPQVLQRLRGSVWACLRHSISSLATPLTAAGLCAVTRGSAEEEQTVVLSATWPTGTPVSTLVSSSFSTRWDSERLTGWRSGDRGAGLLRRDE